MRFFSLNNRQETADFKTATLRGQAPDKGLYFPEYIPTISNEFISGIVHYSDTAIALEVIKPFVGDAIPSKMLESIVEETLSFPIPLVSITDQISTLELFHGPTLAFKDVGARFMSRCLGYFAKDNKEKTIVLVATSGDTGGAVANGFFDVPGVEVVILYPSGKVSSVQEKQLTTLGRNIHALEVEGSFDDCQRMVKAMFADKAITEKLQLSSANSINVARWLPQQFYYFSLWKQWPDKENPPVISVPSGNFGNICAGLLAQKSGLNFKHFIAACNANDTVPKFLNTGNYTPTTTIPTISNAMDVSDPSNFVRILQIFAQQIPGLKQKLSGYSISDKETAETLQQVYKGTSYLLDTHGAVAYNALAKYLEGHPQLKGVILETAHPVKFYDVIEPLINEKIAIPEAVQEQMKLPKNALLIPAEEEALSNYLRKFF